MGSNKKSLSKVESKLLYLKNHPKLSYVILFASIVIGIGLFTDSVDKIIRFSNQYILKSDSAKKIDQQKSAPKHMANYLTKKVRSKDFGLIVGIEDYAALPSVDFASKDALAFKDYLVNVFGMPEGNIGVFLNEEATKENILRYIKIELSNSVLKESEIYVYFSGHGAPDINSGIQYLLLYSSDIRFVKNTGYSLNQFHNDLYKIGAKRVCLYLDCSFSGMASRATGLLFKGHRPALIHSPKLKMKTEEFIIFYATKEGQINNLDPRVEQGLFTYYLLRGLKGEADLNYDEKISINELYVYTNRHVSRNSRLLGYEQSPDITPTTDLLKDVIIGE